MSGFIRQIRIEPAFELCGAQVAERRVPTDTVVIAFDIAEGLASGLVYIVKYMLGFRPLLYIGRISYGLYVYHNFTPLFVPAIFGFLGIAFPENHTMRFAVLSAVSMFIASLSWYVIERPIGRLKDRLTSKQQLSPEHSRIENRQLPLPAEI